MHRWEARVLSGFYRSENSTAFLRFYGLDSDNSGLKFNNLFKITTSAGVRDKRGSKPEGQTPISV